MASAGRAGNWIMKIHSSLVIVSLAKRGTALERGDVGLEMNEK